MNETYNPRQKSWDTQQILPSPIYNIDNQVTFLSKNRTFSNIEVARRNGGYVIQHNWPNYFCPGLHLFLWREHFCFHILEANAKTINGVIFHLQTWSLFRYQLTTEANCFTLVCYRRKCYFFTNSQRCALFFKGFP